MESMVIRGDLLARSHRAGSAEQQQAQAEQQSNDLFS